MLDVSKKIVSDEQIKTAEKMVLRNKGSVKAEDTWPMMPLDVQVTFLASPPTTLRHLACELGLIRSRTGAVHGGSNVNARELAYCSLVCTC